MSSTKKLTNRRIKALLIDWLCICIYLVVLAAVIFAICFFVLKEIPQFTEMQSQWVAALTTVVPVTLCFTVLEARPPYASIGKRKMGIYVSYSKAPWGSALVRNTFKFLPWQLAHMGVINGIFTDFESPMASVLSIAGIFLAMIYVLQVTLGKSHRDIGDMIAGARITK